MSSINTSDFLPFPLYHGTSTLWLHSIKEHGLGGRDIVSEFGARQYMEEAVEYLSNLSEDCQPDFWTLDIWNRMALQEVTAGGFNFRHNGLYVTANRAKALDYAENLLGSELLTECSKVNQLLESLPKPLDWPKKYGRLLELFQGSYRPLLVRIDLVRPEDLLSEVGSACPEALDVLLARLEEEAAFVRRTEVLRIAVCGGDMGAVAEFIGRRSTYTQETILTMYGPSFQTRVVYPAGNLTFEELSFEEPFLEA